MTYALASALQEAIFTRLAQDPALDALLHGAIFDAVPDGRLPPLYAVLGDEEVRDRSDSDAAGARHDFTVSVICDTAGFVAAKNAAAAISDALAGPVPDLARGHVVGLWFLRARAARAGDGDQRRIDLTFRAQVSDG